MKRTFTHLVFLFVLLIALGDEIKTNVMPYHPYRKVGDKYYGLQPIYDWMKILNLPGNKVTQKQGATPRPMQEWIGESNNYGTPIYTIYRVKQVLPNGLLIEAKSRAYMIDTESYETFFLTNYPFRDKVVDQQSIQFLALKTGIYKTPRGDTYDLYDYGIPYNPFTMTNTSKVFTNTSKIQTNTSKIQK